ncbi:hypothetical protein AVV36_gp222 [Pectobacterium bacteriophage PM2]|uniref:Uncharacterized protein n=1 Tax=Pectobacterium bacteriophage PM2 TaxID=1429794 RepID=A0A0A0Q0V8_9CAUD|nr:hypothetical protein AVV36_gp222 [Pectobacterium bacteriophage PM2]AHY25188.1 hypothetical protein PM2_226 [Pectobacterium bacteriophage PM2]
MDYTNFTRKYVRSTFGPETTIELHSHKNGSVCSIDFYWEENSAFIQFENGPALNVELSFKGLIKVGFHDDFRKRDLSSHPSWNGKHRNQLVKLYLRHILSLKASVDQIEAVQDIVEYNMMGQL